MLAGAAIGKSLRRSWPALGAAFLSHFLLDFVPHLDSHALFGNRSGRVTPTEVLGATLDVLVGAVLVIWLARRLRRRRLILGAAFAGVVIDLVDNVPPWSRLFRAWAGTGWLSAFHHGFQHNVTLAQWPLGFGTQLAVIAVAVWVMRRGGLPRHQGEMGAELETNDKPSPPSVEGCVE
jgi:hypothetical protein